MKIVCISYYYKGFVTNITDMLTELGHDVIKIDRHNLPKSPINADCSIAWVGTRLPRNVIRYLPRPRALLWLDGIISSEHMSCQYCKKLWGSLYEKIDLWDLIFVHWKKTIPQLKSVTSIPIVELCHGTINIPDVKNIKPTETGICFIGSFSKRRFAEIDSLSKKGIDIHWYKSGLEYNKEEYFKTLQKYPIHLNLHVSPKCGGYQTRVWDAFSTNRLCISEPMESFGDWVTPGKHYISVPCHYLPETIKYYLEYPDKADAIANCGYEYGKQHSIKIRTSLLLYSILKRKHQLLLPNKKVDKIPDLSVIQRISLAAKQYRNL